MDRLAILANAEKMQGNQKFQKDHSGNPKGKIKGTRNKATLAAEELLTGQLETICQRLIQEALLGNMQAIKMILDRILPIKRDLSVKIEIPALKTTADALESMSVITQAVMKGDISPSEGEALSRIVDIYVKAIEVHDHEKWLNLLEKKNKP
ncbi:MAG: DUF5681 domain-containing protein [Parachlamydiales bacterium]|jgi:hypothetical protein